MPWATPTIPTMWFSSEPGGGEQMVHGVPRWALGHTAVASAPHCWLKTKSLSGCTLGGLLSAEL